MARRVADLVAEKGAKNRATQPKITCIFLQLSVYLPAFFSEIPW